MAFNQSPGDYLLGNKTTKLQLANSRPTFTAHGKPRIHGRVNLGPGRTCGRWLA